MHNSVPSLGRRPSGRRRFAAFTLIEVVIATGLAGLTISAIAYGYMVLARRAEWTAYALAAQSMASMKIEQMRASKWDPMAFPPYDELVASNFPQTIDILDVPISGTNVVYATNTSSVTLISANPPLKLLRADCTWRFMDRGSFTNTVITYRCPDQ